MRAIPIALITFTLAGCASEAPPPAPPPAPAWQGHHGHGQGWQGGEGNPQGAGYAPRPHLFISPMGEPFRATESREVLIARWFDGANTSHDGRLTLAQFQADAARFFAVLDSNHDGVIDADEIRYYENEMVPEVHMSQQGGGYGGGGYGGGHGGGHHGGMGGGGRHGGGGGGGDMGGTSGDSEPSSTQPSHDIGSYDQGRQGAGRFSLLNIPEPVAAADADMNRTITPEEWRAAATRRFHLLDTDNNGVIERSELPQPAARGPAHGDSQPVPR